MKTIPRSLDRRWSLVAGAVASLAAQNQEGFRFRSGVELINVTATVTDDDGRFVSGLRKEDFTVYEDGAAPGGHALQQRARAGEPRHRARHQRQHDARQDVGRALGDRPLRLRPARQGRRAVLHGVRQPARPRAGLDDRSPRDQPRGRARDGGGRHGDVRRDCRRGAAGGRRHSIRRRRCSSSPTATTPTAASRSASSGSSFARARCWSTRSASTARRRRFASGPTIQLPMPLPFPIPGRRRPRRASRRSSAAAARRSARRRSA